MQATRPAPGPGAWVGDAPSPSLHDNAGASLQEDWLTIWQSELAALVLDPELRETTLAAIDAWAAQSRAGLRNGRRAAADAAGAADERGAAAAGRAGPVPAQGPAAVVAAPDARDAELERLAARVAALEAKLARI